jgi:hypothetical protein
MTMPILSGREREAKAIRQANRAAAVGRLMLGEFNSWQDFLQADIVDLENLPRRQLKAGKIDVSRRLSPEIKKFCSMNFPGMNEKKLSLLYEEIKAFHGLELPLSEFELRFAHIREEVIKGRPKHLTISVSLWGLQFKFPEDGMAKDLIEALTILVDVKNQLKAYESKAHPEVKSDRQIVSSLIRKKDFASRTIVVGCFNLIEAYLNGLAWDYLQVHGVSNLSNSRKKILEDTSSVTLREKLKKYPETITGKPLWHDPDEDFGGFINILKPFRDSLVHPSPFSAPAKFGGHDKLRLFYRVDYDTAALSVKLLLNLLKRLHDHVYGKFNPLPDWLNEFLTRAEELFQLL